MWRLVRNLSTVVSAFTVIALGSGNLAQAKPLDVARIYIEYNASANDLGFHVSLDAEDWESLEIRDPSGTTIFEVGSGGGYKGLGLTELFFEGAEPSLDEFPLGELLKRFPEGAYRFVARTANGRRLTSTANLSHAVPDAPAVVADVHDGSITIRWAPVTGPAGILPDKVVVVVGYQVLVESFQVTVPATTTQVTLPPEFVAALAAGEHPFEVLAIDASGNQTIAEGVFVKPR